MAAAVVAAGLQKVAFLTGAGVSVGAGIPDEFRTKAGGGGGGGGADFRSPGGMYDTLRPELLTATEPERSMMRSNPTAVVSTDIFFSNAFPYLELRRPFILGLAQRQWKCTIAHWFVRLCHDKGLLTRLYTQNIDGLDFQTDVPLDKILPVHGTMGTVSCEACKAPYPYEDFRAQVQAKIKDIYKQDAAAPAESSPIPCLRCGQPRVKPDTVLYGGALPSRFFECVDDDLADLDLLFIAGTSLTVGPANSVAARVPDTCVRVLVNMEPVGEDLGLAFGAEARRDVFLQGACDDHFLELAVQLGWVEELRTARCQLSPASQALLDARLPP